MKKTDFRDLQIHRMGLDWERAVPFAGGNDLILHFFFYNTVRAIKTEIKRYFL